jgi:hypothetical protein
MSNGSERGDYVPMRDVFDHTERIHDGIQLMKTYYPYEKKWSDKHRISEITAVKEVNYAWDYEYEDYHPFNIWNQRGSTACEMRDIKQFGADIHLTITLDLALTDEAITAIGYALVPFGTVYLRINHEANGSWFRFNKQHTFKEVSDFFVKCHTLIKNVAPNVKTVFNLSADVFMEKRVLDKTLLHVSAGELAGALECADFWSLDKYSSLHWGWPFEQTVTPESTSYFRGSTDEWWRLVEESYLAMVWQNGGHAKKLFITEFNSDADVDGFDGQAAIVAAVYDRIAKSDFDWLDGIVMYQFRDYGGLGLEQGNQTSHTKQPSLEAYKKAITSFPYDLALDEKEYAGIHFSFSWNSTDYIRGINCSLSAEMIRFVNKFDVPIFILHGPGQLWRRLEVNEESDVSGLTDINLFIPPYFTPEGMRHTSIVYDIKNKLKEMVFSYEKLPERLSA